MTFTRTHVITAGILWLLTLGIIGVMFVCTEQITAQDRSDLIQRGAYASWDVNDACLDSHETCSEALDRQNAELAPFGLEIMEDGSTIPIKLAEKNRKIENAGR